MNIEKTIVCYVFHEMNQRVLNFLKYAVFESNTVDFIIICNNKDIKFNYPSHIRVLYRDNIGYDFGGWSDAIFNYELHNSEYSNFIFINSSVSGPYLKPDFKGNWTDLYIQGLSKFDLFGSTINILKNAENSAHVQSYVFAMKKDTLNFLIHCGIFSKTYAPTFNKAIKKEIDMSRKLIENNMSIGCLQKYFNGLDFRKKKHCNKLKTLPLSKLGKCSLDTRNIYWNEYDVVFVKGNRIQNYLLNILKNSEETKDFDLKFLFCENLKNI